MEEKTQRSIKKTIELNDGMLSVEISAENIPPLQENCSYEMFLDTLIERAKQEFKNLN